MPREVTVAPNQILSPEQLKEQLAGEISQLREGVTSAYDARKLAGRQTIAVGAPVDATVGVVVNQALLAQAGMYGGTLNRYQVADMLKDEQDFFPHFEEKIFKDLEKKLGPEKARQKATEKAAALGGIYNGEPASASYVYREMQEFFETKMVGPPMDKREHALRGLGDRTFDEQALSTIGGILDSEADCLISSEISRGLAKTEMRACMKLLVEARQQGGIPADILAKDVLALMERQLTAMAFQDREAHRNTLGDHGMRHIGYDLAMFDQQFEGLKNAGQEFSAVDRLIGHIAIQIHDIGYANQDVREGIGKGEFGIDNGHNIHGARYVRERGMSEGDPLTKVFSAGQIGVIHKTVLTHDYSEGKLTVKPEAEWAGLSDEDKHRVRERNILAAVRNADNTHAFEDKLPEVLYTVEDSLRVMRLLKTAGEIYADVDSKDKTSPRAKERDGVIDALKGILVKRIKARDDLSEDEKEGLAKAAESIGPEAYKFTVGRICGNQPSMTVDSTGKLVIDVQESAIHQEVIKLFGMKSYEQLVKFCSDVTGKDKESVSASMNAGGAIDSDAVRIQPSTGDRRAQSPETDYQQRITALIGDSQFQNYVFLDNDLAACEANLGPEGDAQRLETAASLIRRDLDERDYQTIISESGKTPEEIISARKRGINEQRKRLLDEEIRRLGQS
ncbi:MAG: hypothetical protein V1744_03715 [Candidatus Altiarchaeota archaeon]